MTIEGDTTLYAKWEGATVDYTIIYMKEEYNSSGTNDWVYENSRTVSGTVGTTAYAAAAPRLGTVPNGYEWSSAMNGTGEAGGAGEDSAVTIEADGSTVLKVYYSLIRYTLTFTHRSRVSNHTYNNASLTIGGTTYTNNKYSVSNVVLGQDISALWPTEVNSGRAGYSFVGWNYTSPDDEDYTRVTKVIELTWELVGKANNQHVVDFPANYSDDVSERAVEYYLQDENGNYVKSDAYSQTYNGTGNLSAKDIEGYTQASTPQGYVAEEDIDVEYQEWVPTYDDVDTWNDTSGSLNVGDTTVRNGHVYTITNKEQHWFLVTYYTYTAECHEEGHYETRTKRMHVQRFFYKRDQFSIIYHNWCSESWYPTHC